MVECAKKNSQAGRAREISVLMSLATIDRETAIRPFKVPRQVHSKQFVMLTGQRVDKWRGFAPG